MAARRTGALRAVKASPSRAVAKAAPKPPAKPKTVAQAAKSGVKRELLVAMRDRLAEAVSNDCPPRDLASLTKRLQDITRDIELLDATAADDAERNAADDDYDDSYDPAAI